MGDFWFARRFPVGHPRNAMAPVSREGWLVVCGFVAAMLIGGAAFVALSVGGMPVLGIVTFVAVAAIAGGTFIALSVRRGDHQRTVADYRRTRAGAPT